MHFSVEYFDGIVKVASFKLERSVSLILPSIYPTLAFSFLLGLNGKKVEVGQKRTFSLRTARDGTDAYFNLTH